MIYKFAAISVPLIELRIKYHRRTTNDTSDLGHVRLYTDHDLRILATDHEFRREMSDALYANNAFDISLCREDAGEGLLLYQIDLTRIQKCRLILENMETSHDHPDRGVWGGPFPFHWHHRLRVLVATLVLNGHHMKAILVECKPQSPQWLLECLRPMAMLRRIALIHFRSASPEMYHYLRFLETRIMSNQDVPVRTQQEFQAQTQPWRPRWSRRRGRMNPPPPSPPRSTDMTQEGTERSLEEMEATRKTLYAKLDVEDEWNPQKICRVVLPRET